MNVAISRVTRVATTQPVRRIAGSTYAVVGVLLAFWFLRDAIFGKLVWALRQGTGDCVVNWLGARAFERHIDPYSADGLRWAGLTSLGHPPTTPLWYLPFTAYNIWDLNQVYGHLLLILLLVHFVLLATELQAPIPIVTALVGYALVMDTSWWRTHVHMIQVSEPIAFLYLLAWILLRRHRDVAAGIMIGLAMSIKPYAALLVLLLCMGRRWRGVVAATVTYLGFAAVATWRFGLACWREYFAKLPATQDHWTANLHNGSIYGIVARWWWPSCGGEVGPTPWQATVLTSLICVIVVGAIVWCVRPALVRRPRAVACDHAVDLPFAMFALASAWMNPVTWEHYYVTLIQPMGIALFSAWRGPKRGKRVWIASATMTIVFVMLLLSIDLNTKRIIQGAWQNGYHTKLHLYEIAGWLPWPVLLLLCGLLTRRNIRASVDGIATDDGIPAETGVDAKSPPAPTEVDTRRLDRREIVG